MVHVRHTEPPHGDRRDLDNLRRVAPFLWEYRGRVLAALAASAFNELRDAVFARVRYRAMRRLSVRLLEHLHRLSLRFHLERRTGAISRDLERGTQSVSSLLNYMVFNILPTAAEFVLVAAILLGRYEARFAVATFATVAVYVAFTLVVTEWRMHFRHTMNALDSEANNRAVDSLINYETVKYFGNERLELARYDETLARWEGAAVKSQTSMSFLNFGQGAIIAAGVTVVMVYAAQGVVAGTMTLGDLVLVNTMMLQLFMPLNFLGIVYRQLKHALADMDRMFRLMEERPEVRDAPDARPLEVRAGEVRFERVDFAYRPDRPILRGVSLTVPPGRKVAVVGPSGAGKSTLVRLLFRFYDVDGGRILIDGQDIRQVTQDSLRSAIGIVPQDTVLFNDTIYYNILYGRPDATREEVERAARLAHIHDFIVSLPQGYETVVGERGLKLSGGEKQRIAIARVLLKDPPIMIGAGHPGRPGGRGPASHHARHRPPALDRGGRRRDRGPRGRARGGAGRSRHAARPRRALRAPVAASAAGAGPAGGRGRGQGGLSRLAATRAHSPPALRLTGRRRVGEAFAGPPGAGRQHGAGVRARLHHHRGPRRRGRGRLLRGGGARRRVHLPSALHRGGPLAAGGPPGRPRDGRDPGARGHQGRRGSEGRAPAPGPQALRVSGGRLTVNV